MIRINTFDGGVAVVEAAQVGDPRAPRWSRTPKARRLEPFYPGQTMREDLVRSDVLPIGAVSAHELELCAAALTDQEDAGAQILAALTRDDLMPTLTDAATERTVPANAILDRAWNGWATRAAKPAGSAVTPPFAAAVRCTGPVSQGRTV